MPPLLARIADDPEKAQVKHGGGNEIPRQAQQGDPEGHVPPRRPAHLEAEEHLPRRLSGDGDEIGKVKDRDRKGGRNVEQGETRPHPRRGVRPGSTAGDPAEDMGQGAGEKQDRVDEIQDGQIDAKGQQTPPEATIVIVHRYDSPANMPRSYWRMVRMTREAVSTRRM